MRLSEIRAAWNEDSNFVEAYELEFPYHEFADALIELRARNGLTQEELARRVGTTQSVIARAESGRHSFQIDLLKRVGDALGVTWQPQTSALEPEGEPLILAVGGEAFDFNYLVEGTYLTATYFSGIDLPSFQEAALGGSFGREENEPLLDLAASVTYSESRNRQEGRSRQPAGSRESEVPTAAAA
jgi:transcriptional regulator with XRE-family HTH domain